MAKSAVKKLSRDLEDVLAEVLDTLKKSADQTHDEAHEALSRSVVSLAEAAQSLMEEAKARSSAVAKVAAKEVKDHPVAAAAAVAVAAAAVVGLLAARRAKP